MVAAVMFSPQLDILVVRHENFCPNWAFHLMHASQTTCTALDGRDARNFSKFALRSGLNL
jgi:hypothetical protein